MLSATGALGLLLGVTGQGPVWLVTAASAWFSAVALRVVQLQRALFTSIMALGAGAWLGAFDLARRTIRDQGLTRFVPVCLLAGYGWMAVAGALFLANTVGGFVFPPRVRPPGQGQG